MELTAKEFDEYSFMDGRSIPSKFAKVLPKQSQRVARYFTFCDALYHNHLGKLLNLKAALEVGDARGIVTRLVSSTVKGGLNYTITDSKGNPSDDVEKFVDTVWHKNLMAAQEINAELYASRKGRSGAIVLNYSPEKKRIIIKVLDPKRVWPIYNEYSDLTGYDIINVLDTSTDDEIHIYKEMYRDTESGILKTAGTYKVVENDGDIKHELISYSKIDDADVKDYDIGLDFLPIVMYNNLPGDENIPVCDLHGVIPAFEKLIRNNYDKDEVAEIQGRPPLVIEGRKPVATSQKVGAGRATRTVRVQGENPRVRKDAVIYTGGDGKTAAGKAYILDVSKLLDALKAYESGLQNTIYINTQLTRIGAGAMEGKDWPAWESLVQAMGPLVDLAIMKHTVRRPKHELLIKFIIRYGIAKKLIKNIKPDDVDDLTVTIKYPNVLPANYIRERETIIDAKTAGLLDTETSAESLAQTGLDIDPKVVLKRLDKEQKAEKEEFIPRVPAIPGGAGTGDNQPSGDIT